MFTNNSDTYEFTMVHMNCKILMNCQTIPVNEGTYEILYLDQFPDDNDGVTVFDVLYTPYGYNNCFVEDELPSASTSVSTSVEEKSTPPSVNVATISTPPLVM